jgi:ABC-2 type transport system permease protein
VIAGLVVVAVQLLVLGVLAALLGWSPAVGGLAWALLLVLLGTLSFGALGVLLGGALKAEVVLALANIVWFVLLLGGGIIVPPDAMPGVLGDVVMLLPSGALTDGMHTALVDGGVPGWPVFAVLIGWGAVATLVATRTTKLS